MTSIRVAIAGVGNCASSLVQGVHFYADADPATKVPGLMHVQFGDYHVRDLEFELPVGGNHHQRWTSHRCGGGFYHHHGHLQLRQWQHGSHRDGKRLIHHRRQSFLAEHRARQSEYVDHHHHGQRRLQQCHRTLGFGRTFRHQREL